MQAESRSGGEGDKDGGASASGSNLNPATAVDQESDSGLGKLDAGKVEDTTPIEEKIEAVASAIGREEREEDGPSQV